MCSRLFTDDVATRILLVAPYLISINSTTVLFGGQTTQILATSPPQTGLLILLLYLVHILMSIKLAGTPACIGARLLPTDRAVNGIIPAKNHTTCN